MNHRPAERPSLPQPVPAAGDRLVAVSRRAEAGRPKTLLILSDDERRALERVLRGPATSRIELRARIVLACATGATNLEVSAELGVCPRTVGKWRSRFVRDRLPGLRDRPRGGAPRKVDEETAQLVIALTRTPPPDGARRWTTRMLAARTGLARMTVHRIWHTRGSPASTPTPAQDPSICYY